MTDDDPFAEVEAPRAMVYPRSARALIAFGIACWIMAIVSGVASC